jgi:hypothetical protein
VFTNVRLIHLRALPSFFSGPRASPTHGLDDPPRRGSVRRRVSPLVREFIASARDILADGRLLLPLDLTQQCDLFFKFLFHGQTDLALAQHPALVHGLQRAEFWDKAQKTAHEVVPKILQQIENAGRILIHGETPPPARRTIGQKIRSVLHMKLH